MDQEEKVSISEFSILPYAQNGKFGNLGEFCFASNFDSSHNLKFKEKKNEVRQNLKGYVMVSEEKG